MVFYFLELFLDFLHQGRRPFDVYVCFATSLMSFGLICLFSLLLLLSFHPLILSYFIIVTFIFLISIVDCLVFLLRYLN